MLAGPENAKLRRNLITVCTMTATIMQAIDTTIANVALPYMQGSFSSSYDQVAWVLTSYIVASAIATSPIGWIADRYGRKHLFIVCAGGFTIASVMCGISQTLEQMVTFRVLQGLMGAGLVPLSQSVMLDSYPSHQRGQAMAIWGMGVMIGPIIGPSLGGWLTEHYSWHWVFLINLPFGIITVAGLILLMDEGKPTHKLRFDWFGFLSLTIAIGALQLMLDRGEAVGWFDSPEIITECVIAAAGFYFFIAHSFTTTNPFIRFELFRDRNFATSTFFMITIGLVLFSTMALLTPFLQHLLGYPIIDAGNMIAARGVGTFLAMVIAGRFLRLFEARTLIFCGFLCNAISLYEMAGFTDQTTAFTIFTTGVLAGFGLGLVFVPLNLVAFLTLPGHLRTAGTALLTLIRNFASSIGISIVIASLTSTTMAMHARLMENITPFNDALKSAGPLDPATERGRALIDQLVTQQATVIAFQNVFLMLMWVCIIAMPFVLLVGRSRAAMARAMIPAQPQPPPQGQPAE